MTTLSLQGVSDEAGLTQQRKKREGKTTCAFRPGRYILPGIPPNMILSLKILSLKIPPGSVVSGRDARSFQSLFLRSP
jgi:hypothetical protein